MIMEGDSKPTADHGNTTAQRSTTLRSPKDLIGVIERPAGKGEGFKVEIDPKRSGIKWTLPDETGDTIRSRITVLRNWATSLLVGDGGEPTLPERPRKKDQRSREAVTVADRAYWARRVLKKLDDVERELINVERTSDADTVRRHAFAAIHNAIVLVTECHLLTIADNEEPIVTGAAVRGGLATKRRIVNDARHRKRAREWKTWNAEAQKIWERQPRWSQQAVAARVKRNLRLTEAVGTIAKRLKKPGKAC
jgi:hypothetical protein